MTKKRTNIADLPPVALVDLYSRCVRRLAAAIPEDRDKLAATERLVFTELLRRLSA